MVQSELGRGGGLKGCGGWKMQSRSVFKSIRPERERKNVRILRLRHSDCLPEPLAIRPKLSAIPPRSSDDLPRTPADLPAGMAVLPEHSEGRPKPEADLPELLIGVREARDVPRTERPARDQRSMAENYWRCRNK
jgi:hypothetical protein